MKIFRKLKCVEKKTSKSGLRSLSSMVLSQHNRVRLSQWSALAQGSRLWCARKEAEARDLLLLSQLAPRFEVLDIDMVETLRVFGCMRVPVPCFDKKKNDIDVYRHAILGIYYPEKAMRSPLPGFAFVQILSPRGVWLPNVSLSHGQSLCLAVSLPAGVLCREIIIMTFSSLSMQSAQLSERDFAGVMNVKAARWWQLNSDRIPLTKASFLSSVEDS